ncbi:hypothetical protein DVH24_037275 [Malus domestica]|uniref:Uncharacterized protein n=1 Tax=Malus domestica TaxID=3750 RepID=A0A498HK21_MALDO|nr:hypothetical protein DVH24_037275 [Malus domestica]
MLSGVSEEIVGGNEELLLLFPIELRANCRALEVEVWLLQMMSGKWIGGMIFLLVGMFTNVLGLGLGFTDFVQGSLNSVCNRYQLLMWAVVYTADEDLESITDTQTELQLMELDAHNFVKFKVQNSHYPNGPLQKENKFFF